MAAAETTRAMRTLLDAYAETSREDRGRTHTDVWRAAAKEIVRATKERDRMLGLLSHELRQSLSAALSAERLLARRPEEPTAQADARVTVEDTGVGIAAESLARIFEPFVRGNECGGGLGIGLALAPRIVALHGGQITAASAGTGRGALFTVTLPLQDPQAA